MNEMTLPFRHRIRNSSPGSLRPSTLPLGHGGSEQYLRMSGEETFLRNLKGRVGTRDLRQSKQLALSLHEGPRPLNE